MPFFLFYFLWFQNKEHGGLDPATLSAVQAELRRVLEMERAARHEAWAAGVTASARMAPHKDAAAITDEEVGSYPVV